MNPVTIEHRALLAAELAANLAEIARWEWSEEAQTAADLARRLADAVYEGADPEALFEVIVDLSDAIDFDLSVLPNYDSHWDEDLPANPAEWLAALGNDPVSPSYPPRSGRWRYSARKAFYALRADLFPEGRRQAA